jgi:hypothetical protein
MSSSRLDQVQMKRLSLALVGSVPVVAVVTLLMFVGWALIADSEMKAGVLTSLCAVVLLAWVTGAASIAFLLGYFLGCLDHGMISGPEIVVGFVVLIILVLTCLSLQVVAVALGETKQVGK